MYITFFYKIIPYNYVSGHFLKLFSFCLIFFCIIQYFIIIHNTYLYEKLISNKKKSQKQYHLKIKINDLFVSLYKIIMN